MPIAIYWHTVCRHPNSDRILEVLVPNLMMNWIEFKATCNLCAAESYPELFLVQGRKMPSAACFGGFT
eukprot:scaffold66210_cov23-Prasinocladus_malaysianus.AAC.1